MASGAGGAMGGRPEWALFLPPRPVHCPHGPEVLLISWGEAAQQMK